MQSPPAGLNALSYSKILVSECLPEPSTMGIARHHGGVLAEKTEPYISSALIGWASIIGHWNKRQLLRKPCYYLNRWVGDALAAQLHSDLETIDLFDCYQQENCVTMLRQSRGFFRQTILLTTS